MQLAHVIPKDHLELSDLGDFDFCLAHVALKDSRYKDFFSSRVKQNRDVYLDNGLWETGSPVDVETMIDLAVEMQPTYVYAPDYMGDRDRTLCSVTDFGDRASNTPGFNSKIIGVMQGGTRDEWFGCAVELAKLPVHVCHTIAVNTLFIADMYEYEPYEGARRSKSRIEILMMIQRQLDRFGSKRFYATGFGAPLDAQELVKFSYITGVDTAIACIMASQDMIITPSNSTYLKPKGKIDDISLTDQQVSFAKTNIKILNSWVAGGDPFA